MEDMKPPDTAYYHIPCIYPLDLTRPRHNTKATPTIDVAHAVFPNVVSLFLPLFLLTTHTTPIFFVAKSGFYTTRAYTSPVLGK